MGKRERERQRQQLAQVTPTNPSAITAVPVQSPKGKAAQWELYQGAVPHPEHAERYEALLPGCTDRFIGMAERQSAHRHRMEHRWLSITGTTQVLGVIFAGLIVLGAIGAGTYLIATDKNAYGLAAILGPVATVAAVFVYARRSQTKELRQKQSAERR